MGSRVGHMSSVGANLKMITHAYEHYYRSNKVLKDKHEPL